MLSMNTENKTIRIGIIGGSGLDEALGAEAGEQVEVQTPFGKPSSPITLTKWQGVDIAILQRHGIGHVLNPSVVPYQANIFALKKLGVTHIVATGATGSLREEMVPGDIALVDQFIDKTYKRANTFFQHAAVHIELSDPVCPVTKRWLLNASKKLTGINVHEKATYVVMEGPAFSTRAESHMHRAWGGDLIGMTAMPEAKLAREAEMAYALIGLPTDYDCWRPHDANVGPQQLLAEIIGNLKQASAAGIALIREALSDIAELENHPSPAHNALAMGIWSDKTKIDPAEIEKLAPLWGKYF